MTTTDARKRLEETQRALHSPTFATDYERGHHRGMYDGLEEPIARARKAVVGLETLKADASTGAERLRLSGKLAGARLVLGYLIDEQSLRREP